MKKPSAIRVANRFQQQRSRRDLEEEIQEGIEDGMNLGWQGNKPTHVAVARWGLRLSTKLKNAFERATGIRWNSDPSAGLRHHPALTFLIKKYGDSSFDGELVPLKGNKYLVSSFETEQLLFENDSRWQKAMSSEVVVNGTYGGFRLHPQAVSVYESITKKEDVWVYSINRSDPVLVKIVKKMGKGSWGEHSRLYIEKLNSKKYFIHEYDGKEKLYTDKDMIRV